MHIHKAMVWQEVLLAAVGEQFADCVAENDSVCGVSVRIRGFDQNIIQIWNQDSELHSKSSVSSPKFDLVFHLPPSPSLIPLSFCIPPYPSISLSPPPSIPPFIPLSIPLSTPLSIPPSIPPSIPLSLPIE